MPKTFSKPKAVITVETLAAYRAIAIPKGVTKRQAHVILLACLGHHDVEVGVIVGIGYETVRDEMDKLRNLTGLRRKLALAVWASVHFKALEKLCGRPLTAYAVTKPCPSTTRPKSSKPKPSVARTAAGRSAPYSGKTSKKSRTRAAVA